MKTLKGTVKHGQIALSDPLDWPEGTEVRVRPVPARSAASGAKFDDLGSVEDHQDDDPESIARWIAEFDAIPPLQMTPAEEAEWQSARCAQRDFEKAAVKQRLAQLGSAAQ